MRTLFACLMLLCAPSIAFAGTTKSIAVYATNIWVAPANMISVDANFVVREDGSFVAPLQASVVVWDTSSGLTLVSYEVIPLAPGALVVNSTLTRATLRLPDGSRLLWVWTGDEKRNEQDTMDHIHGVTARTMSRQEYRFAVVTGTLAGFTVDSRCPECTQTFAEVGISRTTDQTTPAPSAPAGWMPLK